MGENVDAGAASLSASDGFTIHHVGFAVSDLRAAAQRWNTVTGIGPFFAFDHVPFEAFTFEGEPVVFDHSTAFAANGTTFVELQQFHQAPDGLRALVSATSASGINHLAYVADDPDLHAERLERAGCPGFAYGRLGAIEVRLHDARASLGMAIEIHRANDHLTEQFAQFRDITATWNGRELVRSVTP